MLDPSSFTSHITRYISDGYYLIPLTGKQPLLNKWQSRASNDIAVIEKWLSLNATTGIGIATGRSGLLVVDIDSEEGEVGVRSWEREHGPLPRTTWQKTRRGRHLMFRTSTPARTKAGIVAGVDIRASGGLIVAAPSPHPEGGIYVLHDEYPIAPAPDWLMNLVGLCPYRQVPDLIESALDTAKGGRSEALFRIYRWAFDCGVEPPDMVNLILSRSVGSKATEKPDPRQWISEDYQRFLATKSDSFRPNAEVLRRTEAIRARSRGLPNSEQKILDALCQLALQRQSSKITIGFEGLGVEAGVAGKTVKRRMPALVNTGLIRVAERGTGFSANIYQLCDVASPETTHNVVGDGTVPTSPHQDSVHVVGTLPSLDPSLDGLRFSVLGGSYRYLQSLLDSPASTSELAGRFNVTVRTAQSHSRRLVDLRLCTHTAGLVSVVPDLACRLDEVAHEHGAAGRKEREVVRLQTVRAARTDAFVVGMNLRNDDREYKNRMKRPSVRYPTFKEVAKGRGLHIVGDQMVNQSTGEVIASCWFDQKDPTDVTNWVMWPEVKAISDGFGRFCPPNPAGHDIAPEESAKAG